MDGHQSSQQTTPSDLAWGLTVWGCLQKFNPSFMSFLIPILFPKNLRRNKKK